MMKQKWMPFSGKLRGKGGRGKLVKEGLEEERGIPQHLRRQSGVERTPAYQFVGAKEITHRLSAIKVCVNFVF